MVSNAKSSQSKRKHCKIDFRKISTSDIPLICNWFNTPHVQQFYSLKAWTQEQVLEKLMPYISMVSPVYPYLVLNQSVPIGYVQYYSVIDFPWPGQDIENEIIKTAAGLDLFIGEANFIRKGLGSIILNEVLNQLIWYHFDYCMIDPDIRNMAMIQCCKKVGFKQHKIIETTDALKRPVNLQLMLLRKA